MIKNWLIRTKNNHILGPVSLEKIESLLENKSLNSEDELCSGNGYWFSVKEEDLVDKYVKNKISQSYNPISEAKTVLAKDVEENSLELEVAESQDLTQIGLSLDSLNDYDKSSLDVELLEAGNPPDVDLPVKTDLTKSQVKKVIKTDKLNEDIKNFSTTELKHAKALNSTILYIIAFLCFLVALVGFYFRKNLLENLIG